MAGSSIPYRFANSTTAFSVGELEEQPGDLLKWPVASFDTGQTCCSNPVGKHPPHKGTCPAPGCPSTDKGDSRARAFPGRATTGSLGSPRDPVGAPQRSTEARIYDRRQ